MEFKILYWYWLVFGMLLIITRLFYIVINDIIIYVFLCKKGRFGNHCNLALKNQIKKEEKHAMQFM